MAQGGSGPIRRPPILLISSQDDFATDYVVAGLRRRSIDYCRVNIEDLDTESVALHVTEPRLEIVREGGLYSFDSASLRGVYFRGPSYTRHYTPEDIRPAELVRRQHGWSFLRSLAAFSGVTWIDRPAAVYHAEHKAIQLLEAKRLGFTVPPTVFANAWSLAGSEIPGTPVAIKPIDTLIFANEVMHGFTYTQLESRNELPNLHLIGPPCILQKGLTDKIDVRVTVVGTRAFAASITSNGRGVDGDWRPMKQAVQLTPAELPASVVDRCVQLVAVLGLRYGAIDLAMVDDTAYFLEINPMGEWAWLEGTFGLQIPDAIVELLTQ